MFETAQSNVVTAQRGLSNRAAAHARNLVGTLAMNTIFEVFWYDSTRGMNPRFTDCETDALTTTPLHMLMFSHYVVIGYLLSAATSTSRGYRVVLQVKTCHNKYDITGFRRPRSQLF